MLGMKHDANIPADRCTTHMISSRPSGRNVVRCKRLMEPIKEPPVPARRCVGALQERATVRIEIVPCAPKWSMAAREWKWS